MRQKIIIAVFMFTITFFTIGQIKQVYATAKIGSGYTITNFLSLINTTLVLISASERTEKSIDGYARLFYCEAIKQSYKNEFEWKKIREMINTEIDKLDKEYYSYYEFTGPIHLDEYDFTTGSFPLGRFSKINNVGILTIYTLKPSFQKDRFCKRFFKESGLSRKAQIRKFLPVNFSIKLANPITIKSIEVGTERAKKVVNILAQRKEKNRRVYIRFRIKILSANNVKEKSSDRIEIMFNSVLKEADVFFDEALTMHFAKIKL